MKHIEKDPALERMFRPAKVTEPTIDELIQILRGFHETSYAVIHR
jgi:ATP-dependent Clp protease ATP-binding subunit ClpC